MGRFTIYNSPRRLALFFVLLFISFISAACHEDGDVQITGFHLEGVKSIDEDRLRSVLATSASSKLPWGRKRYFDRARFDADLKRIVAFYADRGFPDARVVSSDAKYNDDKTKVSLTLAIEEGEPIIVEDLQFAGFDVLPPDHFESLEGRLSQKAGQPLDAELLTLSRSIALDEIRDHGYPHARVRITESPGTGLRDRIVTLTAEPGRLAHYGPIEVEVRPVDPEDGPSVSDSVILDQLTFKPGDLYRLGQVQESTRRLYGLEMFQFVAIEQVDPDPASDVVRMRVTVTEGKHQRVRGTVGYGSEEHARVAGNYRHVNFLGGARTAGVEGKWSSLDRGAALTFGEPNLFNKVALNMRAENWFFDQPTYDLTTRGGRATLTRRFGQSGALSQDRSVTTISGGYLGEREDYTVSPEALADPTFRDTLIALGLDPRTGRAEGLLSAITVDINRNTTENLLDARRGYVLSAHLEQAGLGGDYKYLETTAEGRHYWNLNERAVLASRLRVAALGGTDNPDADIPFFKRYFLGGAQSLRGWGRFEVSPLTGEGHPIGGFTSLEAMVEVRFPVTTNIGGVLFGDGGNVWPGRYDFNPADMKYDIGAGVRYRTPVGPLRFDVAWQLTKIEGLVIEGDPKNNNRRWRLHFSVGQAF
ncbi:MAG: BamA/TamA family outer membrane protein [Vicinamibacterales bacterium]